METAIRNHIALAVLAWAGWNAADAQSLFLTAGGGSPAVGDTVTIDVVAGLDGFDASGAAFHIAVPAVIFEVAAAPSPQRGLQPFSRGPLFATAVEFSNELTPPQEVADFLGDVQLLSFAIVMGPGGNRGRNGAGVLATFRLRCVEPMAAANIDIVSNTVHESKLVTADGRGEHLFNQTAGLEIAIRTRSQPPLAPPPNTATGSLTWGGLKIGLRDR